MVPGCGDAQNDPGRYADAVVSVRLTTRLRQVDAAVDVDGLAGEITAAGSGEQTHHPGDIFGLTEPTRENSTRLAMGRIFALALCIDQTRRDEVDGDSAWCQLNRKRLRKPVESC